MRAMRAAVVRAACVGGLLLATWGVALAAPADDDGRPNPLLEHLGTIVLAVGALGTAAFGVVDGLKLFAVIDLAGFERLFSRRPGRNGASPSRRGRANLDPLVPALALAYGESVLEVLKAQYRSGRAKGDLPRTLRQGVRIGLGVMPPEQIAACARALGLPEQTAIRVANALVATRGLRPPALGEVASVANRPAIDDEDRSAMARLETAIDARIEAALVLAETLYVTQTKIVASFVAVGMAVGVGAMLGAPWHVSLMVGLVAVPLAPVAHDAATALQQAVKALKPLRAR